MRILILALALPVLAPPLRGEETRKEARSYQVPYKLTQANHVLVRVKINGKGPYNFILDTGAPALYVTTALGKKLGLTRDKDGLSTLDRFHVEGGVILKNTRGRVEDPYQLKGMNGLGLAGTELHGIIGYSLLARYRLEFDFTKHKMVWQPLDFNPTQAIFKADEGAQAELDALNKLVEPALASLQKKPEQEVRLRGFLGIVLEDQGAAAQVLTVLAGTPAAAAGLKRGDRITHFQGQEVHSAARVLALAARLERDETAKLVVVRNKDTHTVSIKAGKGF